MQTSRTVVLKRFAEGRQNQSYDFVGELKTKNI